MTSPTLRTLQPLEAHWDRIVRRPLSADELGTIERSVGLPIPACIRSYLQTIGLFTDLATVEIEPFDRLHEFGEQREYVVMLLGDDAAELFPIGHDGAGDVYVVPSADQDDPPILFVDHEICQLVPHLPHYTEWLARVVEQTLNGLSVRLPNGRKSWHVQFTFSSATTEQVLAILRSVAPTRVVGSVWMASDVSPAEVRKSTLPIEFDGVPLVLGKLEHASWRQPLLFLDFREPVETSPRESRIRRLDELFRPAGLGYQLVDYGPMPDDV
jgi:hypothetical protein